MSNTEFTSFLTDFKELDITLEDIYNKYKDDLNNYKKA
jgi:hypothetical protein